MRFELDGVGPRLKLGEQARGLVGDAILAADRRQRVHRRQASPERAQGPTGRIQRDDANEAVAVLEDQDPQLAPSGRRCLHQAIAQAGAAKGRWDSTASSSHRARKGAQLIEALDDARAQPHPAQSM